MTHRTNKNRSRSASRGVRQKTARANGPRSSHAGRSHGGHGDERDKAPQRASAASPCPHDGRCGGCRNVAVPYDTQLARKDARIANLFPDAAKEGIIRPIAGMENPFHYRNKVMSPFAAGKKLPRPSGAGNGGFAGKRRHVRLDREVLTGMYEPHSHRLVPTDGCLIENEEANRIVATIARLMGRFGIPPYKEGTGAGFLRHAVIRVGHESGEIIVTLVTNGDDFPNARAFCRELVKIHPAITTVVQNVNERDTNVVLGERERTLYGPGFILDTLCGLTFRISSQSFYQVNSAQTEVLYRHAIELAGLDGTQTAIDAYCGTGTIGLVAARSGAARVVGVESVASAVRDARQNARHNGVENASFLCADAALLMRALAGGGAFAGRRGEEGATPFDVDDAVARAVAEAGEMDPASCVLFLDPPRSGASKAFLEAASAFSPARIVYISCDPTTQARDVAFLERFGWRIEAVQPVDMFPHTDHIENIVAMSRSGSTSKAR